jgi:hypothetical protein
MSYDSRQDTASSGRTESVKEKHGVFRKSSLGGGIFIGRLADMNCVICPLLHQPVCVFFLSMIAIEQSRGAIILHQ